MTAAERLATWRLSGVHESQSGVSEPVSGIVGLRERQSGRSSVRTRRCSAKTAPAGRHMLKAASGSHYPACQCTAHCSLLTTSIRALPAMRAHRPHHKLHSYSSLAKRKAMGCCTIEMFNVHVLCSRAPLTLYKSKVRNSSRTNVKRSRSPGKTTCACQACILPLTGKETIQGYKKRRCSTKHIGVLRNARIATSSSQLLI